MSAPLRSGESRNRGKDILSKDMGRGERMYVGDERALQRGYPSRWKQVPEEIIGVHKLGVALATREEKWRDPKVGGCLWRNVQAGVM